MAGLCALLLSAMYFVHSWQMNLDLRKFDVAFIKGEFLPVFSIVYILLMPSMVLLAFSGMLKESFVRIVTFISLAGVVVLAFVFYWIPAPHEHFGFTDIVVADFDVLGFIPIPVCDERQFIYAVIMILGSMLTIVSFSRLLFMKSLDWLRVSPFTIIPAIIVFSGAMVSFYVHQELVDFTQYMDLMQLGSFSVSMAFCVALMKSIDERGSLFRLMLGGMAIGFFASSILQVYNIPILFDYKYDLWLWIIFTIFTLGASLGFIIFKIQSVFEADIEESRQERLAVIGRLASITAHEIRNPLQAIRGLSQFLGSKKFDSESKEVLDVIVKETDHLDIILKRLLDYSRELKLNLEATSLPIWWDELKMIAEEICTTGKIKCLLNDCPSIKATFDREKIRQVVINLLKNAMEASAEGGKINLNISADKSNFTIRVEDEGKGIPPGEIEKIFKEFYTTKSEGSGLGLSISKRIVDAHGGKIYFDPKVKKGATAVVVLPVVPLERIKMRYGHE